MNILKLNKDMTIATILLISGLVCIGLFKVTGSTIDAEGFLHEYFFLLPIGFILIGVSVLLSIVYLVRKVIKF